MIAVQQCYIDVLFVLQQYHTDVEDDWAVVEEKRLKPELKNLPLTPVDDRQIEVRSHITCPYHCIMCRCTALARFHDAP